MKIFSRLSQLFKSNINAALDRMSDPAKEIEQLIEEMDDELRKSKIELRDQLAQVKQQEKRVDEYNRNIYRFQEHAKRAVIAGEDSLAKDALRMLQDAEQKLSEAQRFLDEQSSITTRMIEQIKNNEHKLSQIRMRKETLKSQATIQKQKLSSQGSAFDRFDQLASEIELNEHQAAAMVELAQLDTQTQNQHAAERFDRILGDGTTPKSKDQELEYRLQALKASMGKTEESA